MPDRTWEGYLPACKEWWKAVRHGEDDELIWDGFEWASVEAALHELCHAAVLGEFPNPLKLITTVTDAIEPLPWLEQERQEIDTSAVEYFVCQAIGIPFEKGDITAAVGIQNISESDMLIALESAEPFKEEIEAVLEQLDLWKTGNESGIREIVESSAHDH